MKKAGGSFLQWDAGQRSLAGIRRFPKALDFPPGDAGFRKLEQVGVDVIIGDDLLCLFQQRRALGRSVVASSRDIVSRKAGLR